MDGPALKRAVVDYLVVHHRLSRRRACRLVQLHRSTHYYRSRQGATSGGTDVSR